jgi:hypothetical protein
MFQLKNFCRLTSAAFAFSLFLTPTSAQAFRLTLNAFGQTVPLSGRLDEDGQGLINFNRTLRGSSGQSLSISGTLVAKERLLTDLSGMAVNGTVLNLTFLTVRNTGNRDIVNLPNFLLFSNTFTYDFGAGNVFAHQLFAGGFNRGRPNSATMTAVIAGRGGTTFLPNLLSAPNPISFRRVSVNRLTNIRNRQFVQGRLTNLTLRAGQRLVLPDSACLLPTETSMTAEQVEQVCDRAASVPEPTSVISLLAVGVFGGGFLLKRRRKSTSEQ